MSGKKPSLSQVTTTIVVTRTGSEGPWTAHATDGVFDRTACRESMIDAVIEADCKLHCAHEDLFLRTAAVKAAERALKQAVDRLEVLRPQAPLPASICMLTSPVWAVGTTASVALTRTKRARARKG